MVEEKEKERILNLFDSYWYYELPLIIFPNKTPLHQEEKPIPETEHGDKKTEDQESKFERLPSLRVRSLSDQNLNSTFKEVFHDSDINMISPSSVLPKLQTILSGKELMKANRYEGKKRETSSTIVEPIMRRKTDHAKKGRRKSYSELEYEEVKGFKDMGFVFSDEAKKDSVLVSLVPGLLQKEEDKMSLLRQPYYLSDAWKRKNEKFSSLDLSVAAPLMNLGRNPSVNEVDLRDHLKNWAHTVASSAIRSQ